jgi:O-antigen/teichoic acid export membrane protein
VSNAIDHSLIGIVLLMIYTRKGDRKLRFSFSWAKRLFSKSKYFIVSSMMVTIFAQTDKIMLRFMIDDAATGIYSAASSCAGMTSFVFAAIIDSMRPTIVAHKKKASPFYEINICRLYSAIIYIAILQSLAMTLLAGPIISILYGSAFSASASVLRIVVWHTTFSYIGSVRNIWMLAEGKQQYLWIINLCGALANIALNVFMIRLWGIEGAALASVITQVFTNFVISLFMKPIRYNNCLIVKSLHPRYLLDVSKSILKR